MAKKTHEEWDVYNNVFDNFTEGVLRKLKGQGYFDELLHLIALGKEGNVFLAKKDDDFVCVKIYRLQTCDFNRMYDYLKMDPNYVGVTKRRREVVFMWSKKEYRNLITLYENKIRVPKPIACVNHVLVMEFIGDANGVPAKPLLKEYPTNPKAFFDEIILFMKKMREVDVVHGDLSEYNILNHNDKPVIIDVSQMTSVKNLTFYEYLHRDVKNVSRFFKKLGVSNKEDELYREIAFMDSKKEQNPLMEPRDLKIKKEPTDRYKEKRKKKDELKSKRKRKDVSKV
ncbi:MAG: RIO1 family regulatory kinase/ATPase [Candidatus Woesearchaeota archaeon]|jgi:RIO kinase 1